MDLQIHLQDPITGDKSSEFVIWKIEETHGKQIKTPNVAPLIHPLVNHDNWVEGTAIIFLFVGEGSVGEVYAFDTDESLAPVLDIQFLQGTNTFYELREKY